MGSWDETNTEDRPHRDDIARTLVSQDAFRYYKGLVGQIEVALPHQTSRVLLMSSSTDREGTTEVVIGLGLTLAVTMRRKTAIIDCNTLHPDIHQRFGVADVGLDAYLRGALSIDQALVNTTVPDLYVMPSGRGLVSLATVSAEDLRRLLGALRDRFDYVLIDSAALGSSPESSVLCDKVDAVVLVAKHGHTRREVLRRSKEMVEKAGGKILGVVLNKRKFAIPEFLYKRL